MASTKSDAKQGRSAVTGRFVKESTVKRHPKTTVNEDAKGKKAKKGKKK
jgi:hypothetical protein